MTTATHAIDVELAEDAATKGVEVSEGLRASRSAASKSSSRLTRTTGSSKWFGSNDSRKFGVIYSDLHATILRQLGLDHEKMTIPVFGRTMRLVEESEGPIKEILS